MPTTSATHRKIFWIVLFLLIFGQLMLFSASAVMGLQKYGNEFYFVMRQSITAAIGFLLLLLFSRMNYEFLKKIAFPLILLQIVLVAMTFSSHFNHHGGGANRWLDLGFFTFQPSELAKLTVAIYIAKLIADWNKIENSWKKVAFYISPLAITILLIFRQPDLGTTVLLVMGGLTLLFVVGIHWKYVLGFVMSGACLMSFALWYSPYRRRRMLAFLDPWDDPQGNGFQTIQSFLSIHSGKLFGTGVGNGNSKLFYLPEVHTDFIYSLISEELGFVGAIIVLLLLAYFCHLLFKVSASAKDPFGTYLGFGLAFSFAFQVLVNLGGVVGLLPVKGLPLPFLSWGRSALMINLIMIGVILNICRKSAILRKS